MIRYSESVLRKRIAEIPDGSWSETNMIQDDENWKITVRLTKKDDRLVFDFFVAMVPPAGLEPARPFQVSGF